MARPHWRLVAVCDIVAVSVFGDSRQCGRGLMHAVMDWNDNALSGDKIW